MFRSIVRFITTLGGLLSTKIDEETDSIATTPSGISSAYRSARNSWTRQYQEVRDAVSQLMMVMEQKSADIKRIEKEQQELEIKKRGAVEKFRQTREEKYQTLFQDMHNKLGENDQRLLTLNAEVKDLQGQVANYKKRLLEMDAQIKDLDRKEAEAIADIVSSKQIVELNDRMANLGTSLQDENLQAIERTRQRLKARAKLSDELAGTDRSALEAEVMAAGMTDNAMDEFNKMLADSELKSKERGEGAGPQVDRVM
jgi:chromosome segregation ATPase